MFKSRSHFACGALILLALVSFRANAAVFCQGTINYVGVGPDGTVSMLAVGSIAPDAVYVCRIGTTSNGVTSDACKGVLSTLLTAKASGHSVRWAFNDEVPCGQRATWQYLQNWYWGPIWVD